MADLPWLRLYRNPSNRFLGLAYETRALFYALLPETDNDGVIHLREGALHNAIGYRVGASTGERRRIRRQLEELIEAGYLTHDEDAQTLSFSGWAERQPESRSTRTVREPSPNRARTVREIGPKSAKSLDPLKDTEEDTETEEDSPLPPEGGDGDDVSLPWLDETRIQARVSAAFARHRGSPLPHNRTVGPHAPAWLDARRLLESKADTEEGAYRLLDAALGAFFGDPWAIKAKWPPAAFCGDLGRWLPEATHPPQTDPPDYRPDRDGQPKDDRNLAVWNAYVRGEWKAPTARLRSVK